MRCLKIPAARPALVYREGVIAKAHGAAYQNGALAPVMAVVGKVESLVAVTLAPVPHTENDIHHTW